ncbi:MAG: BamA/TamA family outer membrane protein [Reichenbachiella sp.]
MIEGERKASYNNMKFKILIFFLLLSSVSFGQIRYGTSGRVNSNSTNINYSSPQEYTIAEIEVKGAEYLDKIALVSISGLKVGDKIKVPGDDITMAIKKLWKQGLIGNVEIYATKIEGTNIYLAIELKERPRLSRFEFKGVTKSQESDLKEKVSLIRGRVMTDAIVKNSELTIKKYFYEKGYLNAAVDVKYKKDSIINNSVMLEFHIEKNRKVKIRNVNFVGNEHFSDIKLKSKMKETGERPRFTIASALLGAGLNRLKSKDKRIQIKDDSISFHNISNPITTLVTENVKLNVFKSAKYVLEKYEDDKKALIAFYNSKGYRDAYVEEDTIVHIDENSVDIDIRINPGRRYYFRQITWTGNFIHDDRTLDQVLALEKGDVYNTELIDQKLNYNPTGTDISSLYMDNGYLFFNINPVEIKIEGDSIDVEMRIYEGAQATIRKVYVTGNDRTSDHVIMRELRTLPGQKFSRAELIRTQRELSQLGYFNPETVTPNPIPNPVDETVDIEWSLEERPSDQIELSGGWGGSFGFVGTLGLTFNNFSLRNLTHFDKWRPLPVGDGQKLSLRLQANGRRYQSYSISFSEPWLGGKKPQSFGVSYNYSVQRSVNQFTNEIFGSMQMMGVTVSLGRRLKWPDDYFTLSNSISYVNYRLFQYSQYYGLGFEDGTGIANNIALNTTISRNSVDNPMYPRNGSSVTLTVSLTPPYSLFNSLDYNEASYNEKFEWIEYHKWMFDAKYYLQIAGDLVLEARAHMGYLGSYNTEVGVGPFERFQLGGDGLTGTNFLLGNDVIGLRGYDNNSITPTEIVDGSTVQGGTIYNKFVFELRYPVSLNPSATIYVLGFTEAGNNWLNFGDYNPNDLYKSAGVGVRIFMPAFGLLGIDWGYGFDPDPKAPLQGPSGGQIHFSIGQTLR